MTLIKRNCKLLLRYCNHHQRGKGWCTSFSDASAKDALMWASFKSHKRVVQFLLVDSSSRSNQSFFSLFSDQYNTAPRSSTSSQRIKIVELLLQDHRVKPSRRYSIFLEENCWWSNSPSTWYNQSPRQFVMDAGSSIMDSYSVQRIDPQYEVKLLPESKVTSTKEGEMKSFFTWIDLNGNKVLTFWNGIRWREWQDITVKNSREKRRQHFFFNWKSFSEKIGISDYVDGGSDNAKLSDPWHLAREH